VGIVESMQRLAGSWTGANAFTLMPDDPAVPLESSLRVAEVAGCALTLSYTWVHPDDGPQEGFLFVFEGEQAPQVQAVWLDTWHQKPQPMSLTGELAGSGARLSAPYGDGWG
jgi:hypothetical protein